MKKLWVNYLLAKGNAIKQAEELKALGADSKKQFPDRLIDNNEA